MRDNEKTLISNTSGRYPFSTPDGYFDNLTARIMANIPEEKSEPVKVERKRLFKVKWMAATAVAASLAIIAVVSLKLVGNHPDEVMGSDNSEMMAAYAEANDMSSDEMELYSMLDNSVIYDYLAGYEY